MEATKSMTPLEALDALEESARGNPLAGGKGNPEHAEALAQLPAIREAVRAVGVLESKAVKIVLPGTIILAAAEDE